MDCSQGCKYAGGKHDFDLGNLSSLQQVSLVSSAWMSFLQAQCCNILAFSSDPDKAI